jgi:hypothetical protein
MRATVRNLAVWSVTLALLAGLWLPMTARFDMADADGICGPVVAVANGIHRIAEAQPVPQSSHCVLCHLRHDLAGAFVSAIVQLASPVDAASVVAGRPARGHNAVVVSHTPPRGPPAVS